MPALPLKVGKFSDTGYWLRKNHFHRIDEWIPFQFKKTIDFYNSVLFNSDTFDAHPADSKIASMYFRLYPDKINHSRLVFSLYDLIASIGGSTVTLIFGFNYVFGGYLKLNLMIEIMSELYSDKYNTCNKKMWHEDEI